jgi:hypothetical protein
MPWTIERRGSVLIMDITKPQIRNTERALMDLNEHVDEGGIDEIQVSFDEPAWQTGWAECVIKALRANMAPAGITVALGSSKTALSN